MSAESNKEHNLLKASAETQGTLMLLLFNFEEYERKVLGPLFFFDCTRI